MAPSSFTKTQFLLGKECNLSQRSGMPGKERNPILNHGREDQLHSSILVIFPTIQTTWQKCLLFLNSPSSHLASLRGLLSWKPKQD